MAENNSSALDSNFRTLEPYTAGEQPDFADMIKLNTNENPYPPSQKVIDAGSVFDSRNLRLYPSVDASKLRNAIAAYHGFEADRVFVGVGSDDVLAIIFQTCFNSGKQILFPEITYSFYEVWADLYRINYTAIPLKPDFTIDPADYIGRDNGGIVIANPNAPTSIAMPAGDIISIVEANPGRIVVIDEAYVDFGGESVMPYLDKYPNLVVVRTYSKSRSLAGLRIGYAIASKRIIGEMENVKNSINSYPMNRPSIEMGAASLEDETYFKDRVGKIIETRERLTEELTQLGFKVFPSSANFVFATHPEVDATFIFEELKKKHIYVRHFKKPLINDYLRITVGTDEQISVLVENLKKIINIGK
ncbi:MAG: histidinol-phosphate transaminase [Lachnospiraceae bacterium]|nr:histidinol-phosphate transaminase [Lachnospiraceae bacterium]